MDSLGWLWGALALFGLERLGKLIRKITKQPPVPLEVLVVQESKNENREVHSGAADFSGAMNASLQFLRSGIGVLTHLGTLDRIGIPPPVQGAFWSWPQALRSLHSLVESANQLAEETLIIRTLGSTELADAAYDAAERISQLMQHSQATPAQRTRFVPIEQLEQAVASMVAFRSVLRSEIEERKATLSA
jgi:hypothetical protein